MPMIFPRNDGELCFDLILQILGAILKLVYDNFMRLIILLRYVLGLRCRNNLCPFLKLIILYLQQTILIRIIQT